MPASAQYGVSNSSSSSSLHSGSMISNSSSSSSVQSLTSASSSSSSSFQQQKNPPPNQTLVMNLRKSLDQVLKKKTSICKQLEELKKTVILVINVCLVYLGFNQCFDLQEALLVSKLSPQDLEDVSQRLKSKEVEINSASKSDPAPTQLRDKPDEPVDTSNTELDSTFIADSSLTNINASS